MGSFQQKDKNSLLITKASGEIEPFSPEKLERSLRMTGASFQLVQRVIDQVRRQAGTVIARSDDVLFPLRLHLEACRNRKGSWK